AQQEIELPPRAAKLAVGDRLQSGRLLLFDDVLDLAILDRFEFGGADLAFGAFLARGFERRRPQQAADMIGAKRRLGSLRHDLLPHISLAISTIMRSLAHCWSSARTLPSSVVPKPHCEERHSWSISMNFAASS